MVKEKPNSTRIYDNDGYRRRAACICVRSDNEEEVLLVTSSRRPELWIVPGGGVEPDEEPAVTAMREVLEEAGVLGNLGRSLGLFENSEHKHRTEVFVMSVTEELEEWEDSRSIGRKRQWFTIEAALSQLALHKPTQRHYIMQMQATRLQSSSSASLLDDTVGTCGDVARVNRGIGTSINNNDDNNEQKNHSDGGSLYDSDVAVTVAEGKSESETTEEMTDNTAEDDKKINDVAAAAALAVAMPIQNATAIVIEATEQEEQAIEGTS